MHLEVVLFAIVLFILSQVTGVALEPILDAPDGRVSGPMVNNIRLRCQNDDYTVRPYSDFWLNSTEMTLQSLNLPNLSLDSLDEGMIRFTLTPDFEGYFYCGTISTGSSSDALELVAYPIQDEVPNHYTVISGTSITIISPFKPGKLIQQYNQFEWRKDRLPLTCPRYCISMEDFSLTISDVQLNDNSTCYQITVRVTQDNPFGHNLNWQEESSCISLTVYERPEINSPPDSRVVVDGTSDPVVFTCTAQGYPIPILSWRFNGQSVTNCETFEECGRFQPRPLAIDQATHSVTSQLTLSQVGIPDSGSIDCVAEIPVDQRDIDAVPYQDIMKFSRTTLSVLTNNFVLDIGITTGGDMQLRVSLQTAIQDNLRLVVQFRDADPIRPSRAVENTLNDNFINQREFEYVIKNEELPYSRFQVQLAMEVNGQVGPFTNQSSIYDTGEPNPLSDMTDSCTVQRDCDCNKDILIIALSTGTILILIILAIIFMAVACYCSRRCKEQSHKHEADNRALEALKDNPEGVIKWHHTVRTTTDEVEEGEGGGDADNASN